MPQTLAATPVAAHNLHHGFPGHPVYNLVDAQPATCLYCLTEFDASENGFGRAGCVGCDPSLPGSANHSAPTPGTEALGFFPIMAPPRTRNPRRRRPLQAGTPRFPELP